MRLMISALFGLLVACGDKEEDTAAEAEEVEEAEEAGDTGDEESEEGSEEEGE
mgnify:CR=1 FL=1